MIDIVACSDVMPPSTPLGDGQNHMLGDIVHLAVMDDYSHLGEKVLAALEWTLDHVKAEYILKMDEDSWLDANRLTARLQTDVRYAHDMHSSSWYGGIVHRAPVLRSGKWAVSSVLYPASQYPPYAKGGGYVLSARAAFRVIRAISTGLSPLLSNVEDAMIGLAAVALNVF